MLQNLRYRAFIIIALRNISRCLLKLGYRIAWNSSASCLMNHTPIILIIADT